MAQERCESCQFYDDDHGKAEMTKTKEGLCRYDAPVHHPDPASTRSWPIVETKDWCRHHTPGEPATA